MAFIGNQPAESFTSFATQEFSTSATTSYTLDHAVTNENEIALFVNNVRQQPGSGKAYTATGTALTLSEATASTDTMYCVFLGRALQTVTPSTNSITSSMLGSNFFTGATDVGADLADADLLLIDDGAGGTLRKTAMSRVKTYVGGGITEADQFRLTADLTSQGDITSNLERNDSTAFSKIGTGMTESSGVFTFASTGIYKVSATIRAYSSTNDVVSIEIKVTTNNSDYSVVADAAVGDQSNSKSQTGTVSSFVDVTDTSNVKVKFRAGSLSSGTVIEGNSSYNKTVFEFIRLGDT